MQKLDLKDLKPQRRNFIHTIVLANNGSVVEPEVWKPLVGDVTGRELKKSLKKNGFQQAPILMKDAYVAAKDEFKLLRLRLQAQQQADVIDIAYRRAGYHAEQRVTNHLRAALPMFKMLDQRETIRALAMMIKAFATSGVLSPLVSGTVETEDLVA